MNCLDNHHHSQICDSYFFGDSYSTAEGRAVFCDFRRMQRWLDVEVALLRCQSSLGIIPASVALELEQHAFLGLFDKKRILEEMRRTNHSLIPLLNAWEKAAGNDAGQYIHFGATTQDIQDTAMVLEIRDIFSIIERDLQHIIATLKGLARQYRDLVIIGRTHGQHALPTTLGLKIAVWLDELCRHAERLIQGKSRILVAQLFGGVGTMAAFTDKAWELNAHFAAILDLSPGLTAWHSARDRVVEFLSIITMMSGTCGKIANEIYQLARNEIGELEEVFHAGKIGSSTMPHKRNPELCEQAVVLSRLIKGHGATGFDSLISEHERDYRSVRLEWVTVTDASLYFCGQLSLMKSILDGLIVHAGKIEENVRNSAAMISTEALMFLLGKKIGKQRAHRLLYDISMTAYTSGRPLIDLLLDNQEVREICTRTVLEEEMKPEKHIGAARQIVDRVIGQSDETLKLLTPQPVDKVCSYLQGSGGCKLHASESDPDFFSR